MRVPWSIALRLENICLNWCEKESGRHRDIFAAADGWDRVSMYLKPVGDLTGLTEASAARRFSMESSGLRRAAARRVVVRLQRFRWPVAHGRGARWTGRIARHDRQRSCPLASPVGMGDRRLSMHRLASQDGTIERKRLRRKRKLPSRSAMVGRSTSDYFAYSLKTQQSKTLEINGFPEASRCQQLDRLGYTGRFAFPAKHAF